jgi:elongation factor 1-gamma
MTSVTYSLYTYSQCFNSILIQIACNFTNTKLEIINLDNLSEINIKKLINKSPTGTFPLLQIGDSFFSGTLAITKLILSNNSSVSEILYGKEARKRASNDSWMDFTSYSIWPLYDEIIGQITGKFESNGGLFSTALADLTTVLQKVDKHLTFKSFLVDHKVSLADIVLTIALHPYFTLAFDEQKRNEFPNLTRLFLFVSEIKEVSSVLEKKELCSNPSILPLTPLTQP